MTDIRRVVERAPNLKILGSQMPTPESWREVGSTGNPAFGSGWSNQGGSYETAAFYKDPLSVVHLKGYVKHAALTTGTIFTLPSGYLPSATVSFLGVTAVADTTGIIEIASTGTVVVFFNGTGTEITLDGITFRAY